MKRPSAMIMFTASDREKEATRKRQRTQADSSTLQAALILVLTSELQLATSDLTVKPSQSPPSLCEMSSSLQSFVSSPGQVHHDKTTSPKKSLSVLTSQQQILLDRCLTHDKHHKLEVANPIIAPSVTANTRITTTLPSLPSGKPLLAPPRLPHLKLGERLSRQ